jgi:hypothetical protein
MPAELKLNVPSTDNVIIFGARAFGQVRSRSAKEEIADDGVAVADSERLRDGRAIGGPTGKPATNDPWACAAWRRFMPTAPADICCSQMGTLLSRTGVEISTARLGA